MSQTCPSGRTIWHFWDKIKAFSRHSSLFGWLGNVEINLQPSQQPATPWKARNKLALSRFGEISKITFFSLFGTAWEPNPNWEKLMIHAHLSGTPPGPFFPWFEPPIVDDHNSRWHFDTRTMDDIQTFSWPWLPFWAGSTLSKHKQTNRNDSF